MRALNPKALPLALLIALTIVASPIHAAAQSAASDPEVQAQIDLFSAWVEGQIEIRGLPGIVVGVVAGDHLVWAEGFGHADLEADRVMETDTRFRMASHSKLFTATAIMQLREEGKVRLDDPVTDYLPWFTFQGADPDDPPVTIEHLLTHSSGLPREAGSHWTDWDFPTPDEVRALMPDRRAPFSPEVRWKYSNLAYTIAGMVVEEISGMSWADYLQRNIFDPLGMSASSVDSPDPLMATGYGSRMPDGSREVIPFVDARGMAAATGLTSTVEDMARFVSAQFRRGARGEDRLLSTASLREMHRVRMLETSNPAQIAEELMSTVGEAVAAATKAEPEVVAWDPAWERFAGLYGNRWGRTRVLVMNERLVLMSPWAGSVGEPRQLEPIGDGTFRLMAPTGGSAVGEIVRFVEEDGEVVRMITGDSYSNRIR
jgi:CubicO group peptidase (beta-lactamase class C family)